MLDVRIPSACTGRAPQSGHHFDEGDITRSLANNHKMWIDSLFSGQAYLRLGARLLSRTSHSRKSWYIVRTNIAIIQSPMCVVSVVEQ